MTTSLLSSWIAFSLLSASFSGASSDLGPRQYGGVNVTQEVLGVFNSISGPFCNATAPCIALATSVVPRCLRLRGDPGCWCGNHDPVHYCAICMSNPTDNTTTPDQTQMAAASHQRFHSGCEGFELYINGTSSLSSSAMQSTTSLTPTTSVSIQATEQSSNSGSGSKSSNTGVIVGAVAGCLVALGVLAAATFLAYQWIKKKQNPPPGQLPSTVGSPEHKYTTPPPMLFSSAPGANGAPGSNPSQGQFGQFPGMSGPTGPAYGSPLPYTVSSSGGHNNQRDSTATSTAYDSRML